MKKYRLLVVLPLVAALAVAIPATTLAGAGKNHDMKAEVVSIDEKAKTITIKDENGENHTAPLLGKALEEAKMYKAGDKVTVTCKDNDKGEHEGVAAIKKITPAA
jgi:ribosomal protein S17